MAIDPANLPIFGDPNPVEPPAAARAACVLLLAESVVTGAQLAWFSVVGGADLTAFLLPLTLLIWFALSARAGRPWARPAAVMAGGVLLLPGLALGVRPGELGGVLLAFALLVAATRLMYHPAAREHFEREEQPENV
ncbi:hypothetical protein [Actinokineospora bangkokensis]|uniref:DUF2568 domain-containing protein n=1 Tax=Actinokineospora bangkokensis TaxID=1193682 RepID=A0A1Q9LP59_9PSEU|nr:hypothetical protein [Actinokineospora bangkokensis]OLR93837.1 hypothetical protein BJP25_16570 [Actinokineospora bangkokensis]